MRRILGNVLSLLASSVINRITTFILYALVARYMSTFEFGQMSLALTFFYMFQVAAVAGLETLLTRVVANNKSQTNVYFVHGSLIVIGSSVLSMGALVVLVSVLQYSRDTSVIILLLSLALLPYALSMVAQSIFQAWERMQYIAYANISVNALKIGLAFLLLTNRLGLYSIIFLLVFSFISVLLVEWFFIFKHIIRPSFSLDLRFALSLIRASVPFLGIDVIIAVMSSINVVLLSKFLSESEVGLYSAAGQLLAPLGLVYQSVVISVFPLMCRKFDIGVHDLKRASESLIELLFVIALPAAVLLFFMSNAILTLLYGADFGPAAGVLRILAWTVVPTALAVALGQVLFASLRETTTLKITIVDVLVSIALGFVLIGRYGLAGAAMAALLTRAVDFVQHYVAVSAVLPHLSLWRIAWKSVAASACMAACFVLMQRQGAILAGIVSSAVYLGTLLLLTINAHGGYSQVKVQVLEHYFSRTLEQQEQQ
jgi:O-antigen/teichoic acid export membrane protein